MDMLTLEGFSDKSFDAVLDKAAMDALMCDEGSPWDPNPGTIQDATAMCTAVSRVLVDGGVLVMISFAQPHFRTRYLTSSGVSSEGSGKASAYGWAVSHEAFGEPGCLENFVYVCRKSVV
jgi:hypothetical protein